ncbi:MAG: ABC transporter ATP-binding protein [Syntrophaceae bacterium]
MSSSILEVSGLIVKRGGVDVLDIPAFKLQAGARLALIGPNGAGKSTLLLTLAGLIKPAAGEITFQGQPLSDLFAYRKRIACVFQEPLLFDTTVHANIAAGLKLRHMRSQDIRQQVRRCAERFGIPHLLERSARKISGGEAQRTSLARAFALEPEIVFLDEPFASLDPPTREALLEDLHRILNETSTTAVLSTHDQEEALRLADEMAVMNAGGIVQVGRPEEVMNHPADEFVAGFVGTETVIPGTVTSSRQGTLSIDIGCRVIEAVGDAAPDAKVILCIRPENVTLATPDGHASSARNVLTATVVHIIPRGFYYKVELDAGCPLTAYVTRQSIEELGLMEGLTIIASFKATAVHVIMK